MIIIGRKRVEFPTLEVPMALVRNCGKIRRGRVWFTTSPAELASKKPAPKSQPVVVRRTADGRFVRKGQR